MYAAAGGASCLPNDFQIVASPRRNCGPQGSPRHEHLLLMHLVDYLSSTQRLFDNRPVNGRGEFTDSNDAFLNEMY